MPDKNKYPENMSLENKKLKEEISRLKKQETYYQEFFDIVPIAYQELDRAGRILKVNQAWRLMLGFSQEEVIGRPLTDFILPENRKFYKQCFLKFKQEGTLKSLDCILVHRNGQAVPVQMDGVIITGPKGNFKKTQCVVKDMRQIKQTEDRLKHERDFSARIAEISPVGITVANASGELTFANRQAEEILGLTSDTISTRTYNDPLWKITDFEGKTFPPEQLPFFVVKKAGKSVFKIRHAIEWPNGKRIFLSINASPIFDEHHEFNGMVASIEDISEQVRIESTYQMLIEHSRQGFAILQDNRVVFANHAFEEILGYSLQEMLSFSQEETLALVHPEDRDRMIQVITMRITGKDVESRQEFRIIKKDGKLGWVESLGTAIRHNGLPAIQVSFMEVTGRKIAEENLKHAKEFSETIIELANVIILSLDLQGNITLFNRFAERLTGYSKQEMLGTNWFTKFIDKKNQEFFKKDFKEVLKGRLDTNTFENEIVCKDGDHRLILWRNTILKDLQGDVTGVLSVGQDITEQRKAVMNLIESEERFRQIAENIQDVVHIYDPKQKRFLYVSSVYEKIWQRKLDQVYQDPLDFTSPIHPDEVNVFKEAIQNEINLKQTLNIKYRILLPDGKIRWIWTRNFPVFDKNGKVIRIAGISRDITLEKTLEQELATSADIVKSIPSGLLIFNYIPPAKLILSKANPAAERLTGRNLNDWIGKEFDEIWGRAKSEGISKQFLDVIATGHMVETESIEYENEEIKQAYRIRAFQLPEQKLAVAFEDITQRKRVEEALKEREATITGIFHAAPMGIGMVHNRIVVFVNDRMCEMIGYDKEEILGSSTRNFYRSEEEFLRVGRVLYAQVAEKGGGTLESTLMKKTGELVYVLLGVALIDPSNPDKGIIFTMLDITERKKTEESLKVREATINSIFHAASMGIGMLVDRIFVFVNEHMCEMIGYKESELLGESTRFLYPTEKEFLRVGEIKYNQINEKGFSVLETVFKHKDGSLINVLLSSTLIEPTNPSRGTTFTAIDITEWKKVEESLRERDIKMTSLFNASPAGIGMLIKRVIVFVNDRLCDMLGYSEEELLGKVTSLFYPSEEEFLRVGDLLYSQIDRSGVGTMETVFVRKTGEQFHVFIGSALLDPKHPEKGITFTALDISERKKAEAQIERDLREKEVLLREVHHRVKNNLQVICSLLNLQSSQAPDQASLQMFKESESRVRTIAMVHEELYRSEDFSSISAHDYLDRLVNHLFKVNQIRNRDIQLDVDMDEVHMNIDTAVPTGLLINELISNILKHAFPPAWEGEPRVQIRIKKYDEHTVKLTVSDNGIGLPEAVNGEDTETLGFRLIKVLSEGQLGGQLNITRDHGTQFELIYKVT